MKMERKRRNARLLLYISLFPFLRVPFCVHSKARRSLTMLAKKKNSALKNPKAKPTSNVPFADNGRQPNSGSQSANHKALTADKIDKGSALPIFSRNQSANHRLRKLAAGELRFVSPLSTDHQTLAAHSSNNNSASKIS